MANEASIDIITPGGGGLISGNVAQRLMASNFNVNALRPQTALQKDEWVAFDKVVVETAVQRLRGVKDLMSQGLSYNLPNALGRTRLEWERVSDMSEAEVSMAGVTAGQGDRVDFDLANIPLPMVHKEFTLNIRAINASRNEGTPLDVTQAQFATRKVTETLESMLFLGSTIMGSSTPIHGYTSAPNRNTAAVTASWVTATGAQIIGDMNTMIDIAKGDHMYGPYVVYVPSAVMTHLGDDYKAESDKTILQRLKELPSVSDVRESEQLTGTNIVSVQMTSDVVDIVNGIQPTMVHWSSQGGFVEHFKVIAIMPPRIKSDYADQSGIVHMS